MKYTLPILALVASAYCAPLPQPATNLDHAVAPVLSSRQAVADHLDASKRASAPNEEEGEPNFYDAGKADTTQDQDDSSSLPSLNQVGTEVGAALGTTLKPILTPVLDLTGALDITKRGGKSTRDDDPDCEPSAVPATPPAFGQPTKHNPNPNSGDNSLPTTPPAFGQPTTHNPNPNAGDNSLPATPPAFGEPTKHNPDPNASSVPNNVARAGQTPKTGPTMASNGAVTGSGSTSNVDTTNDQLSASITLKTRAVEADKREEGFAAIVLENGLVAGATEGLTAGSRARSLQH